MINPPRDEFLARYADPSVIAASLGDRRTVLVPVWREILFDTETAVTAYAKIVEPPFGFLLESVVGGETWARFTFLGTEPKEAWRILSDGAIERWTRDAGWGRKEKLGDPFDALNDRLRAVHVEPAAGLPRFVGGAVGFLGYDMVRHIERLPSAPPDDRNLPDAIILFTDTIIAIDNLLGRARIITLVDIPDPPFSSMLEQSYDLGVARIDAILERLRNRLAPPPLQLKDADQDARFTSSSTRQQYENGVQRIRDYIAAGDVFQVVLSHRLSVPLEASPFDLYRALRSFNPSPYLYYLELDGLTLVGSSPEVLVRVEQGRVFLRPIAGTRARGRDAEDDAARAEDMLNDEKERAEHLMLVDLGRNDVGRVARYGTVRVPEYMKVETYSHVLHLVSQVEGELRAELNAVDVLRACFPAGTVSGAPKVRAMEIIDELEPRRRGPYAGAVGYIGYGAESLDTAIAIRTLVAIGGDAYIQVGAGIVADSVPALEYEETLSKARVLLRVLRSIR
ncbi:MAG: anthranilate synthase component I [Gemmatimonadota bacterium]